MQRKNETVIIMRKIPTKIKRTLGPTDFLKIFLIQYTILLQHYNGNYEKFLKGLVPGYSGAI